MAAVLCIAAASLAAAVFLTQEDPVRVVYLSNTPYAEGSTEDPSGYSPGDLVEVRECGFSLPGHTFLCWNTSPDGDGQDLRPGEILPVVGNRALYAIWIPGSHPIFLEQPPVGGRLSAPGAADSGQEIVPVVSAEEGYCLGCLRVLADDGSEIPCEGGSFVMPSCGVTVSADLFYSDHEIFLPVQQKGYSITSDVPAVPDGGSYRLTLVMDLGYTKNDGFAVKVNGSSVTMDSLGRCRVGSVTEDQHITVEGIENAISHGVSVPSEQRGYVLTTDRTRVPQEESYTLTLTILDGYSAGDGFRLSINGSEADISGGTCEVSCVMALQRVDVTGVEPIPYEVVQGSNTVVLSGGVPVSTATVEDVLTVEPLAGYVLPEGYAAAADAADGITSEGTGFRITSDTTFPSIFNATPGEHTEVLYQGGPAATLVSGSRVTVHPTDGYVLPDGYLEAAATLDGITVSDGMLTVSADVVLPGIYRIEFIDNQNMSSQVKFETEGHYLNKPSDPTKNHYVFQFWSLNDEEYVFSSSNLIQDDISLVTTWNQCRYNIEIGENILIYINNEPFYPSEVQLTATVEDIITVEYTGNMQLPNYYKSYIECQGALIEGEDYKITEPTRFVSVFEVLYSFYGSILCNLAVEGENYMVKNYYDLDFQVVPPFSFNGWYDDEHGKGNEYSSVIENISANHTLIAMLGFDIGEGNISISSEASSLKVKIGSNETLISTTEPILIFGETKTNKIVVANLVRTILIMHNVSINWEQDRVEEEPIELGPYSIISYCWIGESSITICGLPWVST